MKSKPIVPRSEANRDVDEAIDHYLSESAEQAALGFIDALEKAYAHIARHPATGSPRLKHSRPAFLATDPLPASGVLHGV